MIHTHSNIKRFSLSRVGVAIAALGISFAIAGTASALASNLTTAMGMTGAANTSMMCLAQTAGVSLINHEMNFAKAMGSATIGSAKADGIIGARTQELLHIPNAMLGEAVRSLPQGGPSAEPLLVAGGAAWGTAMLSNTLTNPDDLMRRAKEELPHASHQEHVQRAMEIAQPALNVAEFVPAAAAGLLTNKAEMVGVAHQASHCERENNSARVLMRGLLVIAGGMKAKDAFDLTKTLAKAYEEDGVDGVVIKLGEEAVMRAGASIISQGSWFVLVKIGDKVVYYTPQYMKEVTHSFVERVGDKFFRVAPDGVQEVTTSDICHMWMQEARVAQHEAKETFASMAQKAKDYGSWKTVGGKKVGVEGTQWHHIISDKHPRTMNHALWERAGMTPQDEINKMLLPTVRGATSSTTARSVHEGRHLDVVNMRLAKEMQEALDEGQLQGWSKEQFADALKGIIRTEQQALKLGERALNKHARSWAMPQTKPKD